MRNFSLGETPLCLYTGTVLLPPTQVVSSLLSASTIEYQIWLPSWEGRCQAKDQRTLSAKLSCLFMLCQKICCRKSGDIIYWSWRRYILGCSDLRVQLDQALTGTLLDGHMTTRWVSWIHTFYKWSKIGTEANNTITSVGIEMPCLPKVDRNGEELNCSTRIVKPPKVYPHQTKIIMPQNLRLRSLIPLEKYEDVLHAKWDKF